MVDSKSVPLFLKLLTTGLFAVVIVSMFGSLFFILENMNTNLGEIVQPFFLIAMCLITVAKWLSFISNKQRVRQVFDDLQMIVDDSKSKRYLHSETDNSVGFQGPELKP